MQVAIINAVFPPEPVVSAQIGRDLAEELTQRGVTTRVICPYPSRPVGANYAVFLQGRSDLHESQVDGYAVARVPSFTAPAASLIGRLRESWSFGRQSCAFLARQAVQPDVIYANTWPMFAQGAISAYAARRGIPVVLHIQDVYPESWLSKIPRLAATAVGAVLRSWERKIVHRASRLVVVSESMRQLYAGDRGIPVERLHLCLNWQDEAGFRGPFEAKAVRRAYSVPEDQFTFLYLGNIGPVAGLEELIQAFGVAAVAGAQLVIVGDGSRKNNCVELVAELGLANVRFVSDHDVRNVARLQSMADVFVLPQRKGAGQTSIPSKLAAYLFSAKPILAVLDPDGDTAGCIREAACGWAEEPGKPEMLARRLREIAVLPERELLRMGENARAYGLEHFSRRRGVTRLTDIVMNEGQIRQAGGPPFQPLDGEGA